MTSWAYTAPPGSGKTLGAVNRIRDHLWRGRRVATNLDLWLEKMLPKRNRTANVIRLPDRPTAQDLIALGLGHDKKGDEKNYGLLVLDEMATWLNSRDWNQPGRRELFNWLAHHRKQRWNVVFILQNLESLDKQVRESLVEYHCQFMRLDKMKLPIISNLGELLTLGLWDGYLPAVHIGVNRYVAVPMKSPPVTERIVFRGHDLYDAYDTEQVISEHYEHGMFSYLPPWQQFGRYQPPTGWEKLKRDVRILVGLDSPPKPPKPQPSRALAPLLQLPPDLRWQAARRLVSVGKL